MKKAILVALALFVAGATFNSVQAQQPVSRVDTLSYAIGMAQTQGLKDFLTGRLNVNMSYIDDFVKGLTEGAGADKDQRRIAYYAGLQIGQQIANQMMVGINKELFGTDSTRTISKELFMAGFISGTTGKDGLMSVSDASQTAKRLMQVVKDDVLLEKYGANKKAGEDFLAANANLAKKKKKSGITVLPSGLQYKVLVAGNGPVPKATDKVKVKYEGRLLDGTVFDSTEKHGGEPISFRPSEVIKGWTEALTMMPVGSKWQLYIPQELAYGSRATGDIPPFSVLIFDVEVVEIEAPAPEKDKK